MRRTSIWSLFICVMLWAAPSFAQTTIYSQTITGNDNGNSGYSFRTKHVVTGNSLTQIRVTFSTDTAIGTLIANNCSIGKWAGTNADTTTTPQELLFSGGHGFTITTTPNGTIASDWLTISGWSLTNGDTAVVVCDFGATADVGTGTFVTGNDEYYHGAAASYNVAAPAGYTQFNETALASKIETQSATACQSRSLFGVGC